MTYFAAIACGFRVGCSARPDMPIEGGRAMRTVARLLFCKRRKSFFGGGDKIAEFGGVFFAGGGFDAAGDVDGVGAGGEDSLGDVVGGEAAGEDEGKAEELVALVADRDPVERLAGAAVGVGGVGVEKDGV